MTSLRRPFAHAALLGSVLASTPLHAQGQVRISVPLSQLQAAVVTDSNDPAAHYNFAVGLMSQKKWAPADTELRAALALDHRFASASLALAYLPYLQRPEVWRDRYTGHLSEEWRLRMSEADRQERAAYLIDPLVDRRILGAAIPRTGWIYNAGDAGDIFNLVFQGLADFQEAKYEDAFHRFNRLVELNQLNWFRDQPLWIYWYRGNAAALTNRWDIATTDMQMILDAEVAREKSDTTFVLPLQTNDYRYVLAVFHQRAGHLEQAEQLFREALDADVGLYMANVHLAEILEARQQWEEAAKEREHAVAANPDDPSLLMDWGVTLGKGGQFGAAEARLLEAAQGQPRDPRTFYWLGIAQQQLGKGPEAKQSYQRFLALAPSRYAPQIAAVRQRLAQIP